MQASISRTMFELLKQFLENLIDPVWIQSHGGLYLVAFIIFAETGLFAGFFLPGDSLLFVTGMVIAQHPYPMDTTITSLLFWVLLISLSGILGNYVGYWFGKRSGSYLYSRKDNILFKKKYLEQAQEFYEEKGGAAIVLARFVPIVRTFAPIVAGIVKMDFPKFSYYNILGSILWVGSMTVAGYLLGDIPVVKNNLEIIVVGIILITTLPVFYKMITARQKAG